MPKRGNGEGTIRKNVDRNRWEGRLTIGHDIDGNLIRKMVTARTKGELLTRMNETRTAAEAGLTPARRDLLVGRFLDGWLQDSLPGTVSLITESQYRQVVNSYIKPRIGNKKLRTLSARDVSAMLNDMAKPTPERPTGYSPTARRLARAVLRRALRHAEVEGMVSRNVAAIAPAVRQDRTEGRTMTPAEARTFLEAIDGHPLEAAFVVALSCGLRLAELLGLAWDCVELEASHPRLLVRRGLKWVRGGHGFVLDDVKTNRSRRTVMLPPIATDALRVHRRQQAEIRLKMGERWPAEPLGADLVFRSKVGGPVDPSKVWKELSKVTKAAGLGHWHPHELRHSAASLLLAQGLSLKSVSDLLGHSSITITSDIYGHLLDEQRAETAAVMDRALRG